MKQEKPITGIVEIRFKREASEEDVQEIINNLYINNRTKIDGMEYKQFANEAILLKVHDGIKELTK